MIHVSRVLCGSMIKETIYTSSKKPLDFEDVILFVTFFGC